MENSSTKTEIYPILLNKDDADALNCSYLAMERKNRKEANKLKI